MPVNPNAPKPDGEATFAALFCQRYGGAPDALERRVLRRCLYRTSLLPLAWLVRKSDPDFFRADLQMITDIRAATTEAQVREILTDHHTEFLKRGFLRNRLKLRVSRTKLISLARAVLRSEF